MKLNKIIFALSAVTLLAGLTWAADSTNFAFSVDTQLDTRSKATMLNDADKDLDTRSYTEDWSAESPLNTKKIIGTMFLIR